ncbi:SIMPL domain-containing protein [Marinivivus vitaminiproducens]|uniref:SIMPL domain-containing protein n=1 Tax=Marinivivus vitaminiproducens TaxID=3035935 RepID=UPI0027A22981|nr:SIMPL domain-containing protein [Geminicoccaceae bacterium SCSIO 64248]
MTGGSRLVLVVSAVILAIGLAAGGWFAGLGVATLRQAERLVTVKGLAERAVRADLAIWPLRFARTGDDLAAVQSGLDRDLAAARRFLEDSGFSGDELEAQPPQVTDLLAQAYRPEDAENNRFIIGQTLLLRTEAVDRMVDLSRRIGDLVRQGVVLGDSTGGPLAGPTYLFTGLNAIKPAMIAEATANARDGASQFARDSDSRLGPIQEASQGLFVILPRDPVPGAGEESQVDKTVRVVSTISFRLED